MDSPEARTFRRRAPRPRSSSRPRFQDGMENSRSEAVLKDSFPAVHGTLRSRSRATSRPGRLSHTAPASFRQKLHLLKWAPVAIIGLLLFLYLTEPLRSPAKRTICKIVLLRDLEFCSPVAPVSNPYFDRLIAQEAKFVDLYRMTEQSAGLWESFIWSRNQFLGVLFDVMVVDPISAKRLEPRIRPLGDLVTQVEDSIDESVSKTLHALLLDAYLATSDAMDELKDLLLDDYTFFAPVYSIFTLVGLIAAPEDKPATVWSTLVTETHQAIQKTLPFHRRTLHGFTQLQSKLDNIAAEWATGGDADETQVVNEENQPGFWKLPFFAARETLPKRNGTRVVEAVRLDALGQASAWKALLQSRSKDLKDVDKNADICASFYQDILLGGQIFSSTTGALQQILEEIEQLKTIDPSVVNTKETSWKLTIASLRDDVELLKKAYDAAFFARDQRRKNLMNQAR
ncbi:hypothetical protein TI39_contig900g00004 [Zymoseptoria brevis]|uniref:Uncharacterized protein n=1 Tax=Zymoseptoria brevis TaxID=1047168 RepID=A0A0F4GES7_9PEZI|nr:hypothetical protein TI39_contig900g00004 [Zymoseptoria brevis]